MEIAAEQHLSGTSSRATLTLAALGVVYGDIGTSPLTRSKTFNLAPAFRSPETVLGGCRRSLGADDRCRLNT
jgi:K+ transporter